MQHYFLTKTLLTLDFSSKLCFQQTYLKEKNMKKIMILIAIAALSFSCASGEKITASIDNAERIVVAEGRVDKVKVTYIPDSGSTTKLDQETTELNTATKNEILRAIADELQAKFPEKEVTFVPFEELPQKPRMVLGMESGKEVDWSKTNYTTLFLIDINFEYGEYAGSNIYGYNLKGSTILNIKEKAPENKYKTALRSYGLGEFKQNTDTEGQYHQKLDKLVKTLPPEAIKSQLIEESKKGVSKLREKYEKGKK